MGAEGREGRRDGGGLEVPPFAEGAGDENGLAWDMTSAAATEGGMGNLNSIQGFVAKILIAVARNKHRFVSDHITYIVHRVVSTSTLRRQERS